MYNTGMLAENGWHKEALEYLEKYKYLIDFNATGYDSPYYYYYYSIVLKNKLNINFDKDYVNLYKDYILNTDIPFRAVPNILSNSFMFKKHNDYNYIKNMLKIYKSYMDFLLSNDNHNLLFYIRNIDSKIKIRNIEYVVNFHTFMAVYLYTLNQI